MSFNAKSMRIVTAKGRSFLRNTTFLVLSSLSHNILVLLFWVVAAELYSKQNVGIAASVLSSLLLIELVSRLGLDYSIIRFFPEKEKCQIFSTSIILASSLSLLLGIIYVEQLCFSDLGEVVSQS